MADEFLRTDTFLAWANGFDTRLTEALSVRDKVDETAKDVAVLKDRSDSARKLAFGSLISSVSSLLGVLWSYLAHSGR